jgi:hypothetical protein
MTQHKFPDPKLARSIILFVKQYKTRLNSWNNEFFIDDWISVKLLDTDKKFLDSKLEFLQTYDYGIIRKHVLFLIEKKILVMDDNYSVSVTKKGDEFLINLRYLEVEHEDRNALKKILAYLSKNDNRSLDYWDDP